MKHTAITATTATPSAIVDRNLLKAAIDTVATTIEPRPTAAILANVHIGNDAGDLILTGSDIDTEINVRVPGDVDSRMSTTVPAGMLKAICAKAPKSDNTRITVLPPEPGTIVSDATQVTFGKTNYDLVSLPCEDFPEFPKLTGKTCRFDLPGGTFWNALDAVKGAISTEETRYYLNGVFLTYVDDELRAVTTDGHRLYCQTMMAPKGCSSMPDMIIPHHAVKILHKLLKGKACPASVSIEMSEASMIVSWGSITVKTKAIDGTFPDYTKIIPSAPDKVAAFVAKDLDEGVQAVSLMKDGKSANVALRMAGNNCELSVSSDNGRSNTSILCTSNFRQFEIGFNSSYLRDMISTACPAGGYVTMKFTDAASPAMITGEANDWYCVLMPARL